MEDETILRWSVHRESNLMSSWNVFIWHRATEDVYPFIESLAVLSYEFYERGPEDRALVSYWSGILSYCSY